MFNIFYHFKEKFFTALKKIAVENNITILETDFENFIIEPAKEKAHGDLACNIAMTLSKKFSQIEKLNNPRKLAIELINKIDDKNIIKLEIAGPGFINIFLYNDIYYQALSDLLKTKNVNFPNIGKGEKVNLEYASPNPTGPIHVGHTRGAIYGDVLANLLKKVGYDVLKEYYINDAGSQIVTLVKSAYIRYLEIIYPQELDIRTENNSSDIRKFLEKERINFYPGEYLIEVAQSIFSKYGDTLKNYHQIEQHLQLIRDFVVNEMLKMIIKDLSDLGIKHDSYFSEKENLHDTGAIENAITILKNKKDKNGDPIIYLGKLEAPKTEKGVGATPEDYDEKDQLLFRSTSFGDDVDRVVKKADGTPTYFAADLAYILNKFQRGATKLIMPLGYDHAGYVKRLNAAVNALTENKAELKVILCQMVKFVKNGEPLKMSKRAGNFIAARDVIDDLSEEIGSERGADVLRFIMLSRKNDAPFDFDLAKVIEQSKDNPIFYVQYAYARCCSVIRNLETENILPNITNEILDEKLLQNLTDESEIELIKKIVYFPRIIEMSAASFEPHRIVFYLQELAASFHFLWNKGNDNQDLKFIIPNNIELTKSRIYMLIAFKIIIATALEIFNIKPLEQMR